MNFALLTDIETIKTMGQRYEAIRIEKELSDEDVSKRGGVSKSAIYRLKAGNNISLINLIKILRGLGEINNIDLLLKDPKKDISLFDASKPKKKRIHKKEENFNSEFKWGEDE